MIRRTTFLISALLLLILANVLMMSYSSPVFRASNEGYVNFMEKWEDASGNAEKKEKFSNFMERWEDASGNAEKKEKFTNYSGQPGGAKDAYQPIGPFDSVRLTPGNGVSQWRYTKPNEPLNGYFPKFKPGPDNLFMFKDNQCKPECCGASFACDGGGCVCTTPEQRNYINQRGGNRTGPDSDPGV